MTKNKSFWAAVAAVCLIAVGFSGYAIYNRLTVHFSEDTMEIRQGAVPPLPENPAAEEPAAVKAPAQPEAAKPAAPAKTEEAPKVKAVKTHFEYKSGSAKRVSLAGSFTSWKETALVKKNGVWRTDVYILPGNYLYHFVVDGKKTADPGKTRSPVGESIITVGSAGQN